MADKEQLDHYAAELAQRLDGLITWAIENWPHKNFPLMQSDFAESRKEFSKIIGPKLDEGDIAASTALPATDTRQYVDVNPTPWP